MLGLGAYESSSEDEPEQPQPQPQPKHDAKVQPQESLVTDQSTNTRHSPEPSGPVLGPSHDEPQPAQPLPARDSSPFSTSRALIQDLTLPPVPNLDIPPSPPGSPNPAANAKFAHFLSLKKQNVHFNEKLASSASLRNPSLLHKLREHAGIDDQAQYSTSLPLEIWDMTRLPTWGYKEELLKAQKDLHYKTQKLSGQRDTIDFVGSTSDSAGTGSMPRTRPK
ncbi:HCNGP-like protein-domain-containing protein [Aspergillus ambiguus]|uniref:HCNGP domain-containing protein n=1 Tax=Aspergillus ambiguus TaxID=176160 RepID=UPI003CCD4453